MKKEVSEASYEDNMTAKADRLAALDDGFDWIDLFTVVVGVALYIYVARIWQPSYMVKSAFKALAFVVMPLGGSFLFRHNISWLKLRINRIDFVKFLIRILLVAGAAISILLLVSQKLNDFFNVANIIDEVKSRTNASKQVVFASLIYISVVNSFMEEVYFRGYLLLRLKSRLGFRSATWISALLFAVYHLITFRNWFSPPLLLLALSSLTLAGLVLNHLTDRYRSLLPAWLVHAIMNLSIFAVVSPYF